MRTTVTLDEDVAAKLQAEARRSGQPFKQALNDALRRGLNAKHIAPPSKRFVVAARDLGRVSPGLDLHNVAELLDRVEGPQAR